jgi:hypothetical protein
MLAGLDAQEPRLDEVDLVAHDALICADIALRITSGGFNLTTVSVRAGTAVPSGPPPREPVALVA